jgi:hypothetical protein
MQGAPRRRDAATDARRRSHRDRASALFREAAPIRRALVAPVGVGSRAWPARRRDPAEKPIKASAPVRPLGAARRTRGPSAERRSSVPGYDRERDPTVTTNAALNIVFGVIVGGGIGFHRRRDGLSRPYRPRRRHHRPSRGARHRPVRRISPYGLLGRRWPTVARTSVRVDQGLELRQLQASRSHRVTTSATTGSVSTGWRRKPQRAVIPSSRR